MQMKALLAGCLLLALSAAASGQVTFSGSGGGTTTARDNFRTALGGGTTAGANGDFGGLRREINWDGVPDASSSPNSLPANFFNVNSPRGVVFATPGTGFQVSANASVGNVEFDNINAGYSSLFIPFSAQRLFTPIGSNITDVSFFVPGTTIPALVRGFGSIFSDVDVANATTLQFFDASNASLGTFAVPAVQGNETLSFLGVDFTTAQVSRVRITTGNSPLGAGIAETPNIDLVVMDDFIYSTPVPEPGTLAVAMIGLGILLRRRRAT